MKFAIVLFAVFSAAFAVPTQHASWAEFKAVHGKEYRDEAEESKRFQIFTNNLEKINNHNKLYNAGLKSYKMGITKFADMTHEEFKKFLALSGGVPESKADGIYQPPVDLEIPTSVDYRSKGAVNPVKDQGQCGSCWAFSTVGSLESINYLQNGKLLSLSEQNLVDCSSSYGNEGCGGGLMESGYDYIKDNGLESEAAYPYTAEDGTCKFQKSKSVINVSGHINIKAGSESDLASAVANVGPIAVAVDASEWQFYSGGIFETDDFMALNHGVVVVGYGSENGQAYWIVRNSWGPSWGESGYIRVAKDKGDQIGIADMACYPTL